MPSPMLAPALNYHNEGLCVIPCTPRDKNPDFEAIGEWKRYQSERSTLAEINHWWNNGFKKDFNIGIVHGPVSDNYTTLDIDEDNGVTDLLYDKHPYLCKGRIEQSGSGKGYHIPIRVDVLPDWGIDNKGQPIGNKTWAIYQDDIFLGKINLRCQRCQTVAPPSIHPTGGIYRYVQTGPITRIASFDCLIEWLNKVSPIQPKQAKEIKRAAIQSPTAGDDLLSAVRAAWPTCLSVFAHFGMAGRVEQERNDELRLLGNGGLLLTSDGETWYNFEQERGGGIFEAWWFARFGTLPYDKHANFRQVLLEMAAAAGIDVALFYRRGDEVKLEPVSSKRIWTAKYGNMWERVRG